MTRFFRKFTPLVFLALLVGCSSTPGMIHTDGLGVVGFIVARHDAYAQALEDSSAEAWLAESADLLARIQAAGEEVPVTAISAIGRSVATRHDDWVRGDVQLDPLIAEDNLRSTAIFLRILEAAEGGLDAGEGLPPPDT